MLLRLNLRLCLFETNLLLSVFQNHIDLASEKVIDICFYKHSIVQTY